LEAQDYLYVPTTRSMQIVLAKNKKFYNLITNMLKESEKELNSVVVSSGNFEGYEFELITRRNISTNKLEGFSLIFHGFKYSQNFKLFTRKIGFKC